MVRATATDSAQPISNALYASLRDRAAHAAPQPHRPAGAPRCVPVAAVRGPPRPVRDRRRRRGGRARATRTSATTVDALDRELLGVAHPIDHRYLRAESRRGWLYRGPDGAALGYGYATEAGRVGPVAVRDAALLTPVLGHLLSAVQPRGAFALWLPGSADRAVVSALRAGFRLDQFPILLCWDRPFADFSRYLPISPGLL